MAGILLRQPESRVHHGIQSGVPVSAGVHQRSVVRLPLGLLDRSSSPVKRRSVLIEGVPVRNYRRPFPDAQSRMQGDRKQEAPQEAQAQEGRVRPGKEALKLVAAAEAELPFEARVKNFIEQLRRFNQIALELVPALCRVFSGILQIDRQRTVHFGPSSPHGMLSGFILPQAAQKCNCFLLQFKIATNFNCFSKSQQKTAAKSVSSRFFCLPFSDP